MQVEGQHVGCLQPMMATGARVSNAYPTYPILRHNPLKDGLIPDGMYISHDLYIKELRYWMGMRLISLLVR